MTDPGMPPARRPATRRVLLVGGLLLAVIAAAAAAVLITRDGSEEPRAGAARPPISCNGTPRLCDRRLDEVVFPATHNSYSASDQPGWYFANQRYPISRQLDDGIRGLLVDAHYGVRDGQTGRVRTVLRGEKGARNKVRRALSPRALLVADRLAGRVGTESPDRSSEAYLCHTLCELGAEPLDRELSVIRRFLERHPTEVLMLIVEPYVPSREIEGAFERTGLVRHAAVLDRDGPLPTLRELVGRGKRLVVFAEQDGGLPPWYMPAFSFIQDTPLGARDKSDLSCMRFRGKESSPLLLINHWIDRFPPSPRANELIGRAPFLRNRIKRCTEERGSKGGLVAVDFHERSAVVAIARELNGG